MITQAFRTALVGTKPVDVFLTATLAVQAFHSANSDFELDKIVKNSAVANSARHILVDKRCLMVTTGTDWH